MGPRYKPGEADLRSFDIGRLCVLLSPRAKINGWLRKNRGESYTFIVFAFLPSFQDKTIREISPASHVQLLGDPFITSLSYPDADANVSFTF